MALDIDQRIARQLDRLEDPALTEQEQEQIMQKVGFLQSLEKPA